MQDYVASLMEGIRAKNPAEPEFHQAVQEVESASLTSDVCEGALDRRCSAIDVVRP